MKNNILAGIFFLLGTLACLAQKEITWGDLAKVDYTEKFFSDFGEYFLYPKFGPEVKALEGKKVSIVGYYLDIDPTGTLFILSKNPMASCFFCGVGGPETAIELQFNAKPKFRTDDIVMVTGTLKLNADDVEHFNYILEDCDALKKIE